MKLRRRVLLVLATVITLSATAALFGRAQAAEDLALIAELHGAQDTIWIAGAEVDRKQLADRLRQFAQSQGWYPVSIQVQPDRVGLATTLGRRTQGQSWSYDFPAARLVEAVGLQPSEVRFGVKHNRLAGIEILGYDRVQPGFPLDPYPVLWYEATPELFQAQVTLFPPNETRKALGLWGLALLSSVAFAWLYVGRRRGITGNVTLGLYYATAVSAFLVYFLTGLAFIWTWLASSRLAGIVMGSIPALAIYLLTTALVIGDYIARSKGGQARASLRHILRRSAVSWIPVFVGVLANALLTAFLPDHFLRYLGGSASTLVITQAAMLLLAFMLSPMFLRWVYRPIPLHGRILETIEQFCSEHSIRFAEVGYIPRDELSIANAFVAGILPNYRGLYFTEALLDELSDMELRAVIAHELGHVKLRHFWITIFFSSAFGWMAVTLYRFLGIDAISLSQTVALASTLLAFSLSFAAISRRFEYQADRFSARALGSGSFLQSALSKLRTINAAYSREVRQNPFATHPSTSSRIQAL